MTLQVYITDEAELTEDYIAQLRKYLDVAEPGFISRRSASSLPQYIQLIGDSAAWLVLAAGASIFLKSYLSKLGELAAEGTIGLLKKHRQSETERLLDVVEVLAKARSELGSDGSIVIGISLLNDSTGVVLPIRSCDALRIAVQLSRFVDNVEALEKLMNDEISKGHAPLGNAIVNIADDGSLTVEWIDQQMTGKHLRTLG
jgi:hypothetical protein